MFLVKFYKTPFPSKEKPLVAPPTQHKTKFLLPVDTETFHPVMHSQHLSWFTIFHRIHMSSVRPKSASLFLLVFIADVVYCYFLGSQY